MAQTNGPPSRLFLVRHGNTFESDETPVWVGRATDLALTQRGREQAAAFGATCSKLNIQLASLWTSPLKRAMESATLISAELDVPVSPQCTSTLNEIDYGLWEGRSNTEVQQRFPMELAQWKDFSIFPPSGIWGTTRDEIIFSLEALFAELRPKLLFGTSHALVSSNGVLRFVPEVLQVSSIETILTLQTGHAACIEWAGGEATIAFWDYSPLEMFHHFSEG